MILVFNIHAVYMIDPATPYEALMCHILRVELRSNGTPSKGGGRVLWKKDAHFGTHAIQKSQGRGDKEHPRISSLYECLHVVDHVSVLFTNKVVYNVRSLSGSRPHCYR